MRRLKLSEQVKSHADDAAPSHRKKYPSRISTGSTLLDLAISGGISRGGGLPGGILVEIFGPPSCGKTVLLSEIAGNVQRQGGEIVFYDPEARLNKQYAKMFGLNTEAITYSNPNTVPEVFAPVRTWAPSGQGINGIFADSLAALSTEMEMEDDDKMGMRRAKEFSQELRKTCRILADKNFLMVCSNQVRVNVNAGPYEQKYLTSGGMGIPFYASLRLRCSNPQKIPRDVTMPSGKVVKRIVGVETTIDVFKSSIWKPFYSTVVPIIFDYGIDDIRTNLQFVKVHTKAKVFSIRGEKLSNSLEHACRIVETSKLESDLRIATIDLWEDIEAKFTQERKPKHG
jgi:recombination protein RecA